MDDFREKYFDVAYTVFRVLVGLLFMLHGAQKLFGAFTDNPPVPLVSQSGLAGIIEFFGGILIVLGLLTVPAAAIMALEMLIAYFQAHLPNGLNPLMNMGEPALLFFAAFLLIAFAGGRRYSLDALIWKGGRRR